VALCASVEQVVTLRGRNQQVFRTSDPALDENALARAVLGPTGNLRAPAARYGSILLVGFDEDVWRAYLGK